MRSLLFVVAMLLLINVSYGQGLYTGLGPEVEHSATQTQTLTTVRVCDGGICPMVRVATPSAHVSVGCGYRVKSAVQYRGGFLFRLINRCRGSKSCHTGWRQSTVRGGCYRH